MASVTQAVASIRGNDYGTLVVLTAAVYDYILTFSDEVEYVWKKPWSLVSTLFVLVPILSMSTVCQYAILAVADFQARYFGLCSIIICDIYGTSILPGSQKAYVSIFRLLLIILPSNRYLISCSILVKLGQWSALIFLGAADLVMILRMWALYNQSRLILFCLLAFYAVELVVYLVDYAINTKELAAVTVQVLDFSLCREITAGASIWLNPVAVIVRFTLGTLTCLLVVIQFIRQSLQMYRVTKQFQLGRYMSLLTRHGVLYFLAIVSYSIFGILNYLPNLSLPDWMYVVGGTAQYLPAYFIAPRLILSLRNMYARDLRGRRGGDIDTGFGLASTMGHSTVLSTIVFADAGPHNIDGASEQEEMDVHSINSSRA